MRNVILELTAFLGILLIPVVSVSIPSQAPLLDHGLLDAKADEGPVKPQFESPEHASIGDLLNLTYPYGVVSGPHFNYTIQGQHLSFGQVVAFSGDFFYKWTYSYCQPSISGAWNERPLDGLDKALENVDFFKHASSGVLTCVVAAVGRQEKALQEGLAIGQDTAQIYKSRSYTDNKDFSYCTLGYVALALCNWDHFGDDAAKAYASTHLAALEGALQARLTQNITQLKEAYFIEAYGLHFLTDMFSAGHIRTPRRTLHTERFSTSFFPGDQCSKLQHDEDSANGLWVTNALGQSWATYGDKQLLQGRSGMNMQHAVAAGQASVDEIWEAFTDGTVQRPDQFQALAKVPLPATAFSSANFVPLFELRNATEVLYRNNTDARDVEANRQVLITPAQDAVWQQSKVSTEASGPFKNMLPFTRSFSSDSVFVHLRVDPRSNDAIIGSVYGDVDAGPFGISWGMQNLARSPHLIPDFGLIWDDVQAIGNGLLSLVGFANVSGDDRAYHLGLELQGGEDGQASFEVKWNIFVDGTDERPAAANEILYGSFCAGSEQSVMFKYFEPTDGYTAMFEIRSNLAEGEPLRYELDWDPEPFTVVLAHQVATSDTHSTVVGYSHDYAAHVDAWTLAYWTQEYSEEYISVIEVDEVHPAQVLISDPLFGRLISVNYNSSSESTHEMRIESIYLGNGDDDQTIELHERIAQSFVVSWGSPPAEDYLLWFLDDLQSSGTADLIGYISTNDNTELSVIVFPGHLDGTFADPIISPIVLNPTVGNLFNDAFMVPLSTQQAAYNYPGGNKTSAAIVSFFDNYRVMGARIVAPVAPGSLVYELKGQNAAIAGQRADTLSWTKSQGAFGNSKSAIGIVQL